MVVSTAARWPKSAEIACSNRASFSSIAARSRRSRSILTSQEGSGSAREAANWAWKASSSADKAGLFRDWSIWRLPFFASPRPVPPKPRRRRTRGEDLTFFRLSPPAGRGRIASPDAIRVRGTLHESGPPGFTLLPRLPRRSLEGGNFRQDPALSAHFAPLWHDPEKCEAVFRKDHAQTTA